MKKKTEPRLLDAVTAAIVFDYDCESGLMFWKIKSGPVLPGRMVGSRHCEGYLETRYAGFRYLVHRLAWLIHFGRWPVNDIDHINGIRDDNRISNLRDVTRSINLQNMRRAKANSKAKLLGVNKQDGGSWGARIKSNGKTILLGTYKTPELAHAAYLKAKSLHHPESFLAMEMSRERSL